MNADIDESKDSNDNAIIAARCSIVRVITSDRAVDNDAWLYRMMVVDVVSLTSIICFAKIITISTAIENFDTSA